MRRHPARYAHAAMGLACAFVLSACAREARVVDAQPAPVPPGSMSLVLTDPAIVGVAQTANTGEIDAARLAVSRANSAAVRQFAERMITDHSAANDRISALLRDANLWAEESTLTSELSRSNSATMDVLRDLQGTRFDQTYMESQVSMHDWLLRTLDQALVPSTRSGELEAILRDVRTTVAAHLEDARRIRSDLNR